MFSSHNRAFKEWAVSCAALREGRQTLLIRKGGIREEGGTFAIQDSEFFLMPTWEHQNARLMQPEFAANLEKMQALERDCATVCIDSYAVVTTICKAKDEAQVRAIAHECIWNETYIRERFDFNPYDPLYLLLLRVYRLPEAIRVPMLPEYGGCKSWVTLANPIALAGATPALSDAAFEARLKRVLEALER